MATGDKSAQSYGWRLKLLAAVPDGESVDVPAPGFDTRYTDTRYADVTLLSNGAVWRSGEGKVEATFDQTEGAEKATVLNSTGSEWPAGDEIYLFCPHLLATGGNEWDLKEQIWDLQQRVTALEGVAKASKAPNTAPTAPPAPRRADIPPPRPPNAPIRGSNPPPRAR